MSYDNFAQTFSQSRKNHPWPEIDFILDDFKNKNYKSILDLGCGNGRLLEEIDKSWIQVERYLGLDSSKGMVEEARKIHTEYQFDVCDMFDVWKYDFWKILFDSIFFLASFHHLETKEKRIQVLQDVKKLLNQNGRIYITTWNLLEQSRYEKSHIWNGDFDIKIGEFSRYYHGFTIEELTGLFHESGWKIHENRIFEWGRNIISILQK